MMNGAYKQVGIDPRPLAHARGYVRKMPQPVQWAHGKCSAQAWRAAMAADSARTVARNAGGARTSAWEPQARMRR